MRINRPDCSTFGFRPLPLFLSVILLTTKELMIIHLLLLGALILLYINSVFSHEPEPLNLKHLLLLINCQGFLLLLGGPSPRLTHQA
jgi:hypothetical protein